MSEKILFVDDEQHVLDSMKRQLRKRFKIKTASSGQQALDVLKNEGPFSVIVSDMRMPGMDGVQLLSQVKDTYPETIRLMLTGNADQDTATEAVNKGHIFKFLTKPCSTANLVTSLALAQRHYRLITAEKQLLDQTLKGSIKVLSELLSLANPTAFSSGRRVKNLVIRIIKELKLSAEWKFEIAALISQIGCISLPSTILSKRQSGQDLDEDELEMFTNHPMVGGALLENIPRLEQIVEMIKYQLSSFDDLQHDEELDDEVKIGAQILRVINDYDLLLMQGEKHADAIAAMKRRKGLYNPDILSILKKIKIRDDGATISHVMVKDISIGMIAEQDIIAKNGAMLTPKGQEISWAVLQGLLNFSKKVGVQEPVCVRIEGN